MVTSHRLRTLQAGAVLCVLSAAGWTTPAAAEGTLKICYMSHPIQNANVALFEKWAEANDVKLEKSPMSYTVYLPKMSQMLSTGSNECDIIWHNDDWGQLWKQWMEPTGDVKGMDTVIKRTLDAFYNDDGKVTVVPMVYTVGTFFYRTDLVPAAEVPRSWDELVKVSQELQKAGKVKWGYVGGMSYQNSWFSFWWTMWSNHCDIFLPIYERDNKVLAEHGWKPAIAEPCSQEVMDFWWDALHKYKISPEAMVTYGRNEANAIFMAGDAAFTMADSTFWGDFNDPNKSRVAGKVGMAKWPIGPRMDHSIAWNEIWGWGIPKSLPADRKQLAKQALGAVLTDIDGQIEVWKKTGGPPPNTKAWSILAKQDPVFRKLEEVVLDVPQPMHSAYYFPNWPAVQKAYADISTRALSGSREDIPRVLKDGVATIHDAAVQQVAQ